MILHPRSEQERQDVLRLLRVINDLRGRGADYAPPLYDDIPWITTATPKPCYL